MTPMNEPINVACCFNKDWAAPCGVMLFSLLSNIRNHKVVIHLVMDPDCEDSVKERFKHLEDRFNCDVKFYRTDLYQLLDDETIAQVKKHVNRFSLATLFRLSLPKLLQDVDRVLYLDGDIIVNEDISPLFFLDFQGKACMAAPETTPQPDPFDIGKEKEFFSINAGVLLLDLERMREMNFCNNAWKLYLANFSRLKNHDQDILSYLLKDDITHISPRYNFYIRYLLFMTKERIVHPSLKKEIAEITAKEDWAIMHFPIEDKPWGNGYLSFTPFSGLWWKYCKKSPWRDDPALLRNHRAHRSLRPIVRALRYKLGLKSSLWVKTSLSIRHFFL